MNTRDFAPAYRKSVHPQQVRPPLKPAPDLKHESYVLDGGKVLFEKDIPIRMRDGVTLYADLYRPIDSIAAKTPTLVFFAPFGKHGAVPREKFKNMAVDFGKLSKYTLWELPDPLRWCGDWEYSFLSVDPRGTWWSEGGESSYMSPEEGRDGYDIVEWIATQPWSTGNVGWGGAVSYFAMSVYQTAALKPPHLKAAMCWEAISDLYRDVNTVGGIPNMAFQQLWMDMTGNGLGRAEDHAPASVEHPLFDDYWKSKVVDWSLIDVPVFSVTGWSSLGLHLRGTILAWKNFSSKDKYLQIHGGREWSEYYKEDNIQKQLQFWDYFLKNKPNEVENWPRVEIDVRTSSDQSIRHTEPDFPPKSKLTGFSLDKDSLLRPQTQSSQSTKESNFVSFKAHQPDSMVYFDHKFSSRTEITGYSSVKLFVQALVFPDVDLFVAVQKLDKQANEVKFFNSTQQLEASSAMGWLRASHRELDTTQSTPERPVHLHRKRHWLRPHDVVEVDIELWPSSTVWDEGETLRLAVKGTTFTNPENLTQFKGPAHSYGEVRVHFGAEFPSRLLVPIVSRD